MKETSKTDEILQSLDGMHRADAPPFLFTRIQARLNDPPGKRLVKPIGVGIAGLTFSLLLLANILVLERPPQTPKTGTTETTERHHAGNSDYQLNRERFELY